MLTAQLIQRRAKLVVIAFQIPDRLTGPAHLLDFTRQRSLLALGSLDFAADLLEAIADAADDTTKGAVQRCPDNDLGAMPLVCHRPSRPRTTKTDRTAAVTAGPNAPSR
ncbi:hypothetical protein [uncultured Paracoccus sp.]|uniref:hypothetical protein n=1 Tax=uncultured Paracoccus sp. TaxID=189685 RepID=UPI0025D24ADB|nr:hypothetical protein [uncultured Paracoccus sp.]